MLLTPAVLAMILGGCGGGGAPDTGPTEADSLAITQSAPTDALTDLDNAAPDPLETVNTDELAFPQPAATTAASPEASSEAPGDSVGALNASTSTTSAVVTSEPSPVTQTLVSAASVQATTANVSAESVGAPSVSAANVTAPTTDQGLKMISSTTGYADASVQPALGPAPVWRSNFEHDLADWPNKTTGWGQENQSFRSEAGVTGQLMRVFIPKGSIDPGTMKARGLPMGGTGFKATLPGNGYDIARLSYRVRFPADFEQGLGGKLPGLCGGTCNAGGVMPNGTDGFSTRYMWTGNFAASVYAYLPTSQLYGTPIGSRQIPLKRGTWVHLVQEIKLNTVGQSDGTVRVWADGVLVVDARGLVFRTTTTLKINRVFFDVFYGGNSDAWAAPKDTSLEFSEFAVWGAVNF